MARTTRLGMGGLAILGGSFTDRIYEAAIVPEHWPQVLEELAKVVGAKGAILLTWNQHIQGWIGSNNEINSLAKDHFKLFPGANERTRRLLAAKHAGFLSDLDVFTEVELWEEPLFKDFLIPRGYGRGVATSIQSPSGDFTIIHTEGDFAKGPVNRQSVLMLDEFRPHLARASFLSTRLHLERAQAATRALEIIGLPAALLTKSGKLVSANESFESLMPSTFEDRNSRLVIVDQKAHEIFGNSIDNLRAGTGRFEVWSIPLKHPKYGPKGVLHLIPIKRDAQDIFPSSSIIAVMATLSQRSALEANIIQGLFDLTPAEARVASAIASGNTVKEISISSETSIETVRNHIKRVLSKSGLHRQSELVALLSHVALPNAHRSMTSYF